MDPASAWEDEFALVPWGGISPYLGWAFPSRCAHYDRFLSFANASEQELRLWRESMTAYIAASESGGNDGWYRMDACMRGPRLGQVTAQVQAMLRSVSFRTPAR